MQKLILIGGKAGQGITRTSSLIGKAFTDLGYYVFNYRDYQSLIRGGHNFDVLKISDKPTYSHENSYDIIIALDQNTINLHEKNLKGFVLGDKSLKSKNLIQVDTNSILEKLNAPKIMGNNILIGALFKIFGLPLNSLQKTFGEEFKESDVIKKVLTSGYNAVETKTTLKTFNKKNYFLTGNEAISLGAIASGLDIYIAYPMTPSTPVLHFLASQQLKHNFIVTQLENEIAVVNAALGASFAGATTMIGTSGGGFALMAEALSLQGMSEIPLVVYLAQRTAPSTGVPTYTSQADLKFALNVGHGEFPKIVVAPGDAKEAFYRTIEAFYLSHKYRTLSIILGDKHLGESHYSFDKFEQSSVTPSKFIIMPKTNYKSYAITQNGVSPRTVPSQNAIIRSCSYEHDEHGFTTEDPITITKMNDKRLRKLIDIKKEVSKLNPISIYNKGKNLIIGWGSTKGAILDALPSLNDYRFMQVSYISPFPADRIKKEIENSKNIILIENNATGLLGQVITEQTGIFIKNKLLKYDARPFTSEDIIKGVKK